MNEIKYKDVILVGRANKCITDHHKVDNLKAIVKVITRQGNIKLVEFGASYCTECNKYFMEEWQLQKLKDIGRPMCRVPINERHNHHTDVENANLGVGLKTESIIHQYGYNVNAHENMTDKQRQIILMHIIENHIANKAEIKSHLTWLINHNSGSLKMENALAKWRADRQFVDKYMLGSYEAIIVRSITRK